MDFKDNKIAVIGAGIAGLTTAYELKKKGFDVTVFEKAPDVGGRMATRIKDGLPFDVGAQFLCQKQYYPETYSYAVELGLSSLWEPQKPHCHHLFRNNQLIDTAYDSPLDFMRSSHLSMISRLRLIALYIYLGIESSRWSIFDFANTKKKLNSKNTRDFVQLWGGQEVADYIIDPLIAAYQFHSTKELSLSAFFGFSNFVLGAVPSPKIYHVIGEMSLIPRELSKHLSIHKSTSIKEVKNIDKKIEISTSDKTDYFDAVVIATTTKSALNFFTSPTKRQKRLLECVQYAACINVSFRVPLEPIKHLAVVMTPMKESRAIASYVHQAPKGEDSVKNGKSLVNVLLHDTFARQIMNKSDAEIFKLIKIEFLKTCPPLVPFADEIEDYDIEKMPEAMPKFSQETVSEIDEFWGDGQGDNNVFFCGDYLNFPWIEGSIRCGKRVALMINKRFKTHET